MTVRQLHRALGIATLLLFLASGLYMDVRYDHLRGMTDATRLLFRSTHIYLLYTGLLNLAMGLYLSPARDRWARRLQAAGSVMVLAGPLFALAAFLDEPLRSGLSRTFTRPAVYVSALGMVLHWAASLRPPAPPTPPTPPTPPPLPAE